MSSRGYGIIWKHLQKSNKRQREITRRNDRWISSTTFFLSSSSSSCYESLHCRHQSKSLRESRKSVFNGDFKRKKGQGERFYHEDTAAAQSSFHSSRSRTATATTSSILPELNDGDDDYNYNPYGHFDDNVNNYDNDNYRDDNDNHHDFYQQQSFQTTDNNQQNDYYNNYQNHQQKNNQFERANGHSFYSPVNGNLNGNHFNGTTTNASSSLLEALSWDNLDYNDDQINLNSSSKSPREALQAFNPLLPPSRDDLEACQIWLECEAQRETVLKYQIMMEQAQSRHDYTSMSIIQQLMLDWYPSLVQGFTNSQLDYITNNNNNNGKKKNNKKKCPPGQTIYGPLLCLLQPEKLAVILAHEALQFSLTFPEPRLLALAHRLGSAVEAEIQVQRFLHQQHLQKKNEKKQQQQNTDDVDTVAEIVHDLLHNDDPNNDNNNDAQSPATKVILGQDWMYGTHHLQRFIQDEISKKSGSGTNNNNSKSLKKRLKRANDLAKRYLQDDSIQWTPSEKIQLGVAMVQVLLEYAKVPNSMGGKSERPAFYHDVGWRTAATSKQATTPKRIGLLTIDNELYRKALESYDSSLFSSSRFKPMVVPPEPWTNPLQGGYKALRCGIMKTRGSYLQADALSTASLQTVYDGLNVLGRVPWKINTALLAVAQDCWDNNISLGDIPPRDNWELPSSAPTRPDIPREHFLVKDTPEHESAKQMYREYCLELNRYSRTVQKNADLNSLRCSALLKLDQAAKLKDFEKIYFPFNLDFRGRAYPVPPHLSNVGSDMSRGMLTFAEAKPLGPRGLFWLKVHLANLAGHDKVSFRDRAAFVDEHMDEIRESVRRPLNGDRPWWMTLDEPFQGLATCREIVQAIDSGDPESYPCSLPVHMDGSCNGLQHYAALGLDPVGAKAVNLCHAQDTDEPQDVYTGVMEEVIRRVAVDAAREEDDEKMDGKEQKLIQSARLVNGLIDRGVVKRTVMTSVYGVTFVGARTQIQEKIVEKLVERGADVDAMEKDIYVACSYLASVTMDVMGELFTGARETMTWLSTCARLMAQDSNSAAVSFVSPIGVPVVQPYRRTKSHTVVTLLQTLVLTDDSDDLPLHRQRQVTAFPPNYVHSLDSSHMILTAIEMDKRGLTFSAVHDSFWTHACHVDEMNLVLRQVFCELYERPLLQDLKKSWELRYPNIDFPDVPQSGTFDINEVKSAPYFFQ